MSNTEVATTAEGSSSGADATPSSVSETVEKIKSELEKPDEPEVSNGSAEPETRKPDASKTDMSVNRPSYIPPHLMGRDLNNPAQDLVGSGRRVQKPRLGVKVPYRNLTSQIVSQDEIAQEILERSLRKYSYTDVPEGGDVFFAMKLTHRLANKISNAADGSDKSNDKRKENVDVTKLAELKKRDATSGIAKTLIADKKEATSSTSNAIKKIVLPPIGTKDGDKPKENFDSKAEELYAEISSSLTEDCKLTNPVKLVTLPTPANACAKNVAAETMVNGTASQNAESGLDHDTLLAILEDAPELTDTNANTAVAPKPESTGVVKRKKRIKPLLDPNVEKELALKQLMDFETKKRQDRLRKLKKADEANLISQQNGIQNAMKSERSADTTVTAATPIAATVTTTTAAAASVITAVAAASPVKQKKARPRTIYASFSSAPKRFPKKYHRIIKRQLRSSKLKSKATAPEQQQQQPKKQLPEVPEVQIAIDRYIKTYAKRKYKPDEKAAEKPAEKKQKTDAVVVAETVANNENAALPTAPQDENRNETAEDVVDEKEDTVTGPKPKASSKVMREINRLLGDEGAINMIYSIEQKRLPDSKRDTNILPSLRRKKKDLLLKTKLVKNAVLRLSMSSSQTTPARVVRRSSPEASVEAAAAATKSALSPLRKASVESNESNTSDHTPPKARKVAAEASRIIRRHSSSSCYSSDDEETPAAADKAQSAIASDASQKPEATKNATAKTAVEKNNNDSKESQVCNKEPSKGVEAGAQKGKSAKSRRESKEGARDSSAAVEVLPNGTNYVEIPEQISLKEITVRKYDNLVQIILISTSTKMKNALNIRILQELISVLRELQKDDSCRTVLVTSTGSSFCQGIDLQSLISADKTERLKIVNEFINALTNFTKCLSQFHKLLIAGVHGSAVGLGVTMLPFFDMVIASDKATFYTPYVKLGQIPEAGATLTLPHLLGNTVTSELLFGCRMLTATEALQFGLVTRTLWPDKFSEELLPLARGIAGHSSQAMEATKMLLRRGMISKLNDQFEVEANLLRKHWCSDECQQRFKQYLEQEALLQNM